jgi:DNA-binding response OmpR family regulator
MINNLDRNLPPRIMVVDDERDILRIIKRDLESPVSPVSVAKDTEQENELQQEGEDSSSSITSTSSSDVRTHGIRDNERLQEMKERQDQLREQNTMAVGDTFMVETFTDGWNALKALESHPRNYYDLVLTDIRMPKINGFELYRKIREKNPSIKIVFITAFEINKEEFNKVLPSIDVKDFIIKPISMTNLRARLKQALTA